MKNSKKFCKNALITFKIISLIFLGACGNNHVAKKGQAENLLSSEECQKVREKIENGEITDIKDIRNNNDLDAFEQIQLENAFHVKQAIKTLEKEFDANCELDDILNFCAIKNIPVHHITDLAVKYDRPDIIQELINKGIYVADEQAEKLGVKIPDYTPTYVFSTDQGYIVPTLVAISSLISNNPGAKRIIILATDGPTFTELNDMLNKIGRNKEGWDQVEIWDWENEKKALFEKYEAYPLKENYDKLNLQKEWDNEGVRCRFLFPLFFRDKGIQNFMYLDGDILVNKDLSGFRKFSQYSLLQSVIPVLDETRTSHQLTIAPQPTIMTKIHGRPNSFDFEYDNTAWDCGGVVFWNMASLNSWLSPKDLSGVLEFHYGHDEHFIDVLSLFWWGSRWQELNEFDFQKYLQQRNGLHNVQHISGNGKCQKPFLKTNNIYNCSPEYYLDDKDNVYVIHWDQKLKPWHVVGELLLDNENIKNKVEKNFSGTYLGSLKDKLNELSGDAFCQSKKKADLLWIQELIKLVENSKDKDAMLKVIREFFLKSAADVWKKRVNEYNSY